MGKIPGIENDFLHMNVKCNSKPRIPLLGETGSRAFPIQSPTYIKATLVT